MLEDGVLAEGDWGNLNIVTGHGQVQGQRGLAGATFL
jgi:hypothetical protein